jgi:error-prone DNA polymerase
MQQFVHLHVASSYSLRYGTASPSALASAAKEAGMPALALTDRDGVYGAFKHARACAAAGLKPVLGADLSIGSDAGARITVLAIGQAGWASLCRLITARAAGTGPRDLIAASPGLVVLLGPDSDVGQAIAARRPDLAAGALHRWRAGSAAQVAVEITDHRGPGGTACARRMLKLARQTRTTAVLTNAVRYLDQADSPVAQVLDAARHHVPLGTPGLPPHNGRAYLASPAEMAAVAIDIAGEEEAEILLRDTFELASRCYLDLAADLGIGTRHLPDMPGDLRTACEQGLRLYRGDKNQARERLDHELAIIAATALAPYFLTVADVARRIRSNGIRCSIRGSGAGSLVNHLLGISAIDPLAYGLLMERFLSTTRETMPDIDLDVESGRRIEAYRIILSAFGEASCATVAMMETYRARSAIRDVGAAFGLPPAEIGAIAKAFPHVRAAHIGAALAELPELKDSHLDIRQLNTMFRIAERLDGLPRHVAMHPCGVLLSGTNLLDRTPVIRSTAEDLPLSQLDKDDAETAGVIKLDVLGVRMQSALAHALTQIPDRVDLDSIPPDDEPTFELIRSARTIGCFQIESPGQRELVSRVDPRDIEDLIAEISLFRPGPVNSDMITPFVEVRRKQREPSYPHEKLRPVLAETGGVVIFHEQVLKIIDTMTGCGLAEADRVRRRLPESERWFREQASGYSEAVVDQVWQVLGAFGAFGFCKAHAAAFAFPVYQSAWLKCHYPAAFYAGVLAHDPGMYPKRVILQDARLAGVRVLGPDVNASAATWLRTPGVSRPALRVPVSEIRGIADAESARIVAGQPYRSVRDFWERARVSRPVAERLALVGAFDSMYERSCPRPTRRDLVARIRMLGRPVQRQTLTLDCTFDDDGFGFEELVPAGELRDLDPAERVEAELDILGFDISQHVLGFYGELLRDLGVVRSASLAECEPGSAVLVAGVKVAMQTPAVRSGQRIIFATLDDEVGLADLAFFESAQDRCAATLFGSWLLVVRGRVRKAAPGAVTVNASYCWDLRELAQIRARGGMTEVLAAMAPGPARRPAAPARGPSVPAGDPAARAARPALVYPTGFSHSPFAETGTPGAPLKSAPRKKWTLSHPGGLAGLRGNGTT